MTNYKDTLIIRHLSNGLTANEKEQFLKHFGAIKVQCVGSKCKKYNAVIARFASVAAASVALRRLHQLDILGYPLAVEYARGKVDPDYTSKKSISANEKKDTIRKKHRDFLLKLNSWHNSLQPARPPPHHLRYEYPPASVDTLTNICRTLATVPKFYTQVLHLMNRMNLPCPFGPLFPGPELFVTSKLLDNPPAKELREVEINEQKWDEEMTESEESEIEIDDLLHANEVIPMLPSKRRKTQSKSMVKRKTAFIINSAGKNVSSSGKAPMLPEEVFEMEPQTSSQQKKIEMHLSGLHTSGKGESAETINHHDKEELPGFGVIQPTTNAIQETSTENQEEMERFDGAVITLKELRSNRISAKDQGVLPVFKNYQAGAPSCRLYVKNIAKQVLQRDLHYIYRSFLDLSDEEQIKMFDIRLMQEGRMKGQAFITLPSIGQAQTALKETNGFILKNKPLVVQFARSAKTK